MKEYKVCDIPMNVAKETAFLTVFNALMESNNTVKKDNTITLFIK